ncbi:MAG TPA: TIGR04283 family arsenosugar biosynthesis glycosyltransferase [Allosphingosinicella sp.]|jgi:rSAM/selenodomain-associated transferase 2
MLSVVIPTLNAAALLPYCLQRLDGADEIIIVDGGSRDETIAIAEAAGARVIVAPKGRGSQLRAGGEAARGDWLLFLHADTLLEPGWLEAAEAHAQRTTCPACFRFRLDDRSWQARMVERGARLRAALLGLPYGDQGLLVSRTHYRNMGGYRALPLMEDVDLVRRLGRVRTLPVDAITSAERWRRDGWFSRSARNLACLSMYMVGVPTERIARFYG